MDDKQKKHFEQLLLGAQRDLQMQKDEVTRTQLELQLQKEQVNSICSEVICVSEKRRNKLLSPIYCLALLVKS